MIAIISDVHANLEALQAVLADIRVQGASAVYCLGDVVGYGPNPCECIDAVMGCGMVLLGNHDQAAIFDPEGFSDMAARAIFWTRDVLEGGGNMQARERRWEFLAERPRSFKENGLLYVHGSARNPLNEYVFPEDAHNHLKMERIFAFVETYCFQGHTHLPGVFVEERPDDLYRFQRPVELGQTYRLDGRKTLVNVGSVGQPRDGDPRACYVLLDGDTVTYRRVDYDRETTIRKMLSIPDLAPFLSERLRKGQ